MTTISIPQAYETARQHHTAGRLPDAEKIYRQILAVDPNHVDSLYMLGVVAHQAGNSKAATDLIARAAQLRPGVAEYHHNLAIVFTQLERIDEALAAFFRAKALTPNDPELLNRLAIALKKKGRMNEAVATFRQAIAIRPNYLEAWNNLGTAFSEMGRVPDSLPAYRQALAIRPDMPEIHNNLGNALRDLGRLEEAAEEFKAALKSKPDLAELHNNLANVLKDQGDLPGAIDEFAAAFRLRKDYLSAHNNYVFTLNLDDRQDPATIGAALAEWNRVHAEPLKKFIRPHVNPRVQDRLLRVGYVSSDFREHVVGWNMLPLLRHHDRSKFRVYCYSSVSHPDSITEQVHRNTDEWRHVTGASDEQAADLIRNDQIDILVDLTLHSSGCRLLIFARKPAPVQVTYLGYCGTSGMDTIDYRLSDPHLDPPDTDLSYYSEQTVRLPRTYWCYMPAAQTPDVGPLPATANGFITFGSMNNFAKVTRATQALWMRLMNLVKDSHLVLFVQAGSHRQALLDRFAAAGIGPDRIKFYPKRVWNEYTQTYNEIDIGLDPFPYGGGITTCDTLWMGVPVVTLSGKLAVGRGGRSLLNNVGLPDLVASNEDEYVKIAVELANDLPRLAALRTGLRQRMISSPLTNAPQFARDVEAAYRLMWQNYCEVKK